MEYAVSIVLDMYGDDWFVVFFFFFVCVFLFFFFQAEDGIRDFCLSRGLGDVYKRQAEENPYG